MSVRIHSIRGIHALQMVILAYYCRHESFQSHQLDRVYKCSIVLIANSGIDLPSLSSELLTYFLNRTPRFISEYTKSWLGIQWHPWVIHNKLCLNDCLLHAGH